MASTDSNPFRSMNGPMEPERILLAHGGGGRLMHQLIDGLFGLTLLDGAYDKKHDGVVVEPGSTRVAFTTDSFVVHPLFFPGGDIGTLAVWGTVNDLAMCGARPQFLSAGFILEEGFEMDLLRRIVHSMRAAADRAGIKIVTGDTKVVDRGKGHGVYINTAGLGIVDRNVQIEPGRIAPGDVIILNGDIGRHGIAVLSAREGLSFAFALESDLAPLAGPVLHMLDSGIDLHCLRDLTRGGLASALVELATTRGLNICIEEQRVPVCAEVRSACEILGFDPLYVANEGRFIAFVSPADAPTALDVLQSYGTGPSVIGSVTDCVSGIVTVRTPLGTKRIVQMFSGEQLPRIC